MENNPEMINNFEEQKEAKQSEGLMEKIRGAGKKAVLLAAIVAGLNLQEMQAQKIEFDPVTQIYGEVTKEALSQYKDWLTSSEYKERLVNLMHDYLPDAELEEVEGVVGAIIQRRLDLIDVAQYYVLSSPSFLGSVEVYQMNLGEDERLDDLAVYERGSGEQKAYLRTETQNSAPKKIRDAESFRETVFEETDHVSIKLGERIHESELAFIEKFVPEKRKDEYYTDPKEIKAKLNAYARLAYEEGIPLDFIDTKDVKYLANRHSYLGYITWQFRAAGIDQEAIAEMLRSFPVVAPIYKTPLGVNN